MMLYLNIVNIFIWFIIWQIYNTAPRTSKKCW